MRLVLTCEHGGNEVPDAYKNLQIIGNVLNSHRAYDLGAMDLFQYLNSLSDASFYSKTTRLLVELNRSLHHKNLYSEFTEKLSEIEKTQIITDYYLPYRNAVLDRIHHYINNRDKVLHLSIHSFTPKLNGENRRCDIGLLYNPQRLKEKNFCKNLKSVLLKNSPNLNVRFNYPYLGKSDGFTSFLRKQFSSNYIGIEIEVNQKFVTDDLLDLGLKKEIFNAISLIKAINHF